MPNETDKRIVECFETHGAMTIDMFERVALVYGLPMPDFSDANKLVEKMGLYAAETQGMQDASTGKINGIFRKIGKDYLNEGFEDQNVSVGLRRQIDTHKLYFEYTIVGRDGKVLEKAQVLFKSSMPDLPHEVQLL